MYLKLQNQFVAMKFTGPLPKHVTLFVSSHLRGGVPTLDGGRYLPWLADGGTSR